MELLHLNLNALQLYTTAFTLTYSILLIINALYISVDVIASRTDIDHL